MAYLRSIVSKCNDCPKKATVVLVDRWNGTHGEYCAKCGAKALKRQQANEASS